MKQSEFVKWLKDRGVKFEEGTKHLKISANGQSTILGRHPAKEMKKGTVEGIKKQLKLK